MGFDWKRWGMAAGTGGRSELGRLAWNYLDPSKPSKMAQKGAQEASKQYGELAKWGWDKSQEGLGRAQGAFGNSEGAWNNMYLQMNNPGAMETGFANYGGRYLDPSRQEGVFGGLQNKYATNPTRMSGLYGQASQKFSGPSNSETAFGWNRPQLQGPSSSEGYWSSQMPYFNQPTGFAKDFKANKGGYNAVSDTVMSDIDAINKTIDSVGFAKDASDRTKDAVNREEAIIGRMVGLSQNELGNTGGVAQYRDQVGDLYGNANALGNYAGRQGWNYEGPGELEDFAQQVLRTGSNPYLDRERMKGEERVNQQLARRGNFNSGAAMTALGNYNAEADAQKFKYTGDLLNQSQAARFSRLGQGADLAKGVSGERLAQGEAFQGLGRDLSQEQIGRSDARLRHLDSRNNAITKLMGLDIEAARAASGEGLAKTEQRSKNTFATADTRLKSLNDMLKASEAVDAGERDHRKTGMELAGKSDDQHVKRLKEIYDQAKGADDMDLERYDALGRFGSGADAMDFDRDKLLSTLAGDVDSGKRQALDSYFRSADAAQAAQQGRLGEILRQRFGLDAAQADLITRFYGMGTGAYSDAMDSSINASYEGYLHGADAEAARQRMLWKIGGSGVGAYTGNPALGSGISGMGPSDSSSYYQPRNRKG